MISKIKNRLASEQGFTLIELLVVIVILGILVAIAVPSYLSFTSKAHTAASEANVRSAIPAAQSIYANTGSYATITSTTLNAETPGLDTAGLTAQGSATGFCIQDVSGSSTYHYDSLNGASVSTGGCDTTAWTHLA
ncbi:MAG: type II secretion system protein [Actinobacteria bacterium]|nr:type II secretion system protein [Actinomycetota bacterium]